MDLFQLKRVLALLLALFCAPAFAGFAAATIGGGVVKTGSTYAVSGATATAANGAFITPATVSAAGRQVTMPATATIAANAASFAVSAVRLNPAGLMVSLTASWLLSKGLTYAAGAWNQSVASQNFHWGTPYGNQSSFAAYVAAAGAARGSIQPDYLEIPNVGLVSYSAAGVAQIDANNINGRVCFPGYGCLDTVWKYCTATGSQWTAGCAAALPATRPAVEADFTAAGSAALPSDVAQELARANVPIPVADPVLNPAPQVVDYGAPYLDPVTGKTVQMKTRVTPDPAPGDPFRVRQESYVVEVAPAPTPNPADPVPVPAAEQPKDPCLDNPDRIGCMQGGTPEDSNLSEYSVPFIVTPVSVGGSGACPPNPTFQAAGRTFTINYVPMCNAAAWLKPIVLAMAWLAAAMIIAGTVRES